MKDTFNEAKSVVTSAANINSYFVANV